MTDQEILGALVRLESPLERQAFIDRACSGDPVQKVRIQTLLAADVDAATFITPTPAKTVAKLGSLTSKSDSTEAMTFIGEPTAANDLNDVQTLIQSPAIDTDGTVIVGTAFQDFGATDGQLTAEEMPTLVPRDPGDQHTQVSPSQQVTLKGSIGQISLGAVIADRYTLLSTIGEGGMGSVYRAQQTKPIKREVALKLIKAGLDSRSVLARFDAERQALALMDHPNIARVFDGGTTPTGQPFFVMELVKGVPLTDYCDTNRLSVNQRLQLFVDVCRAVQHAHQKGIIHRDLKPGNILVAEVDGKPTPKVIDFGVAKATEQNLTDMSLVDEGVIVGTPTYMSPEQADPTSADIDTRTDVYALGVILYELLVGSPPLDAKDFKRGAILEMLRMVREVDAPRPSTKLSTADALPSIAANRSIEPSKLGQLLKGELDWIVLKALEKDRNRRYESANGFAHDVERFLADEPVEARPPSAGYRLQKFVRRNRGRVIAAGILFLTLIGGIVGTTLGMLAARDQAEETKKEVVKTQEALVDVQKQKEIAEANRIQAVQNEKTANTNAELASKNAKEASENAERANKNFALAERRLEDVQYNAALDSILLAQSAFRDGNVEVARERLDNIPLEHRQWEWHYLNRQFEGSLMTLYGHGDMVADVCFNHDGSQIASVGGYDRTAIVWNGQTGKLLHFLKGHKASVSCCRYSPDGTILATGGEGETLLWNPASGQLIRPLEGIVLNVCALCFSGDGAKLFTGDRDGRIKIFETATGKLIRTLPGHHTEGANMGAMAGAMLATLGVDEIPSLLRTRIDVSKDGRRIVSSAMMLPRVWDTESGLPLRDLPASTLAISEVCFSPDEKQIVVAGDALRIFDAETYKLQYEFKREPDGTVAYSPDSQYLAATIGTKLKIWDAKSGAELSTYYGHVQGAGALAFHPNSTLIATGGLDRTVKIWAINGGRPPLTIQSAQRPVISGIWGPNGEFLVTTAQGPDAIVWDSRTATPRFMITDKGKMTNAAAVSPDSRTVVAAGDQGTIRMFDSQTGELKHTLQGHQGYVYWMSYSPDGKILYSAGEDKTAKAWNAETGELLHTFKHSSLVSYLVVSADGGLLVTCEKNEFGPSYARIWDTTTRTQLKEFTLQVLGHFGRVAISPDNRTLYVSCSNKKVYSWDIETGETGLTFEGHTDRIGGMALNSTGTRLFTAGDSNDRVSMVWDTRTARPLVSIKEDKISPMHLTLDAKSEMVTVGSRDGVLRIYDGRPRRPDLLLKTGAPFVNSIAWHPRGTELVAATQAGSLTWWNPQTGEKLRGHMLEDNGFSAAITNVSYSPDGTQLVVGGAWIDNSTKEQEIDNRIQVLDAQTGKLVRQFRKLKLMFGGTERVGFNQAGNRITYIPALGSKVKVLDAESGKLLKEDPELPYGLDAVSPDGTLVATIEPNGVVRITSLVIPDAEATDRALRTKINPWVHWEQLNRAVDNRQQFAADFHRTVLARTPELYAKMRSDRAQRLTSGGNQNMQMKKFEEAVVTYQRALSFDPDHKQAQQGLSRAQAAARDELLSQYRKRERAAPIPIDRLPLIDLAEKKKFYDTVAELYLLSFSDGPELTNAPRTEHRIRAARAGVLAGKVKDVTPDVAGRWRKQSLKWLQEEVASCIVLVNDGTGEDRAFVTERMQALAANPDFSQVRDADQLAALPEDESTEWKKLWEVVMANTNSEKNP